MNMIKKLFVRIKLHFQAKRFLNMLQELHDILKENGTVLAYGQFCLIQDNILDDYNNRTNSASFFIEVADYIGVYLNNPEQYKGNKQMEVRTGLMKAIYVLLLAAMNELDYAMEMANKEDNNN